MEAAASSSSRVKVSSIEIYPIKSCRGISLSQAAITPLGFRWDRQWLVVNSKGRAYTQRNEPKLALVQPHLPTQAFLEDWQPDTSSNLVLKAPGMKELQISLTRPQQVADGVSVWEWAGSALDEGREASNWFSDFLGKPSRLVRFNDASQIRVVDHEYAVGHKVMFSDGYPFLLLSQDSVDSLNRLLKEPVSVNRFRANIVVAGCEPFAEDTWTEIQISKFTFEGVKLCSRCKVPTINQETGIAGPEPAQTLMKTRSDQILRPSRKQQGKVYFGQNMVWKDFASWGTGNTMKVGDPVYIVKKVATADEAAA